MYPEFCRCGKYDLARQGNWRPRFIVQVQEPDRLSAETHTRDGCSRATADGRSTSLNPPAPIPADCPVALWETF